MSDSTNTTGNQYGWARFVNKVALITGAGSERGIGRAAALALAREGAKIVITDVNAEGVKKVVDELNEIT